MGGKHKKSNESRFPTFGENVNRKGVGPTINHIGYGFHHVDVPVSLTICLKLYLRAPPLFSPELVGKLSLHKPPRGTEAPLSISFITFFSLLRFGVGWCFSDAGLRVLHPIIGERALHFCLLNCSISRVASPPLVLVEPLVRKRCSVAGTRK